MRLCMIYFPGWVCRKAVPRRPIRWVQSSWKRNLFIGKNGTGTARFYLLFLLTFFLVRHQRSLFFAFLTWFSFRNWLRSSCRERDLFIGKLGSFPRLLFRQISKVSRRNRLIRIPSQLCMLPSTVLTFPLFHPSSLVPCFRSLFFIKIKQMHACFKRVLKPFYRRLEGDKVTARLLGTRNWTFGRRLNHRFSFLFFVCFFLQLNLSVA